jgi:chromosome partitioning protein
MISQVIAVANQKGGVGKTTTAVNLAAALAMRGHRTLVVDLDPQGNATTAMGVDKHGLKAQAYDVLVNGADIESVLHNTEIPGLDILPTNLDLTGADLELVSVMARETRLKHALVAVNTQYEYILVDCPPSLGLLTINALTAADSVLVPLQCEYYALEGLSSLLETIELVRSSVNPRIRLHGIVLTMFDRRNRLSFQVESDVRKHFPHLVFRTPIPRNVRLSESPSHGKPVLLYEDSCAGALAYDQLAIDVLARRPVWIEERIPAVVEVA